MHIIVSKEQKAELKANAPNNHLYYGTIIGGNSDKGWDVKYDIYPHDHHVFKGISKSRLAIVPTGAEEPKIDPCKLLKKAIGSEKDDE